MTLSILALDIATNLGWALHKPGMERPFFGSVRLRGGSKDIGLPAEDLRQFLVDKHKLYGFSHLVFEAQHLVKRTNVDTSYRLMALGGMAEWFAFRIGAHCYKIEIGKWRKHFIGRGGGFKRDPATKHYLPGHDPKKLALQTCAEYGWHTDSEDAAEACGILDYFLTLLPGEYHRPWRDARLLAGVR